MYSGGGGGCARDRATRGHFNIYKCRQREIKIRKLANIERKRETMHKSQLKTGYTHVTDSDKKKTQCKNKYIADQRLFTGLSLSARSCRRVGADALFGVVAVVMVVIVSCMRVWLLRVVVDGDVDGVGVVVVVVVVVVVLVVVLLLGLNVVVVATVIRLGDTADRDPAPVRISAANSKTERVRSTLTTSLLAASLPPAMPLDSWYW